MRTRAFGLGLALIAAVCVGAAQLPSAAGGDKPSAKAGSTGKKGQTKAQEMISATGVDFSKELKLGFPSLVGLGARIEQARLHPDPVGLAGAAKELAAAEKVAGTQATIKSDALLKEAITLAKLRAEPAELKAVAYLTGGKTAKDLLAAATKAAEDQAQELKDRKSGIKKLGVMGTLHVDSRVQCCIRVYVNGKYRGMMGPMGDIYPYVGDCSYDTTQLFARTDDGCKQWQLQVSGSYKNFHWILNP